MKKYPVGIQSFRKLREEDWLYVDKTEQLFGIIQHGGYYFLSRPRRFGKSLLCSTINELYSGAEALFQGLWIANQWDFAARKRPVIWLRFASLDYLRLGLETVLHKEISEVATSFGLTLPGASLKEDFQQLLELAGATGKVVLIIDEYDKPIIDFIDEPELRDANQAVLKNFYSVLKDSDEYLELLFMTGVAAFSKVSIFSDLNHVTNLTLLPAAYTLTGITEAEIDAQLGDVVADRDRERMRAWYNGYSWGGDKLYNPFSLLSYLKNGRFMNYWFETGTPTFLVKLMRDNRQYTIERIRVTEPILNSFTLDHLNSISILFQTGYLTVVDQNEEFNSYTLDYPNQEVKQALEQLLLIAHLGFPNGDPTARVFTLVEAFRANDLPVVMNVLNATLAELPYDFWRRDDEYFFHAIIHLVFSLLGIHVRSEVHSAGGRCDALVETATHVYALEFKVDGTVAGALEQINDRGYLRPFVDDQRSKMAVGINFDGEERQILGWEAVRV